MGRPFGLRVQATAATKLPIVSGRISHHQFERVLLAKINKRVVQGKVARMVSKMRVTLGTTTAISITRIPPPMMVMMAG
jgi:hypothetical protein